MIRRPPRSPLFPSTPLFRSAPQLGNLVLACLDGLGDVVRASRAAPRHGARHGSLGTLVLDAQGGNRVLDARSRLGVHVDRRHAGTSHHANRSEEHTSELQSQSNLVCRLLLEKKKNSLKSKTTVTQFSHLYKSQASTCCRT